MVGAILMTELEFRRTGKITLRSECGNYLIIRYIQEPQYMALHGPQTARVTLGRYATSDAAKAACEAHRGAATGEKNPGAT